MARTRPQCTYTVQLQVRVDGPEDEWEIVAKRLARKITGLRLPVGYVVTEAEIDSADEIETDEPEPCEARIWHGPGHQSSTTCRVRGPHEVHEAVYGGDTFAEWRGPEAMTGFFDEPPELD